MSSTVTPVESPLTPSIGAPYRLSRVKKFQLCLWFVALFVLVSMKQDIFLLSSEAPEDTKVKNQTVSTLGQPAMPKTKPTTKLQLPVQALPPTSSPTMRQPTLRPTTPPPDLIRTIPPQPFISPSNFTIEQSPEIYTGKSLDELPPTTQDFLKQYCDLQNQDWYPDGTDSWKRRAPYVMIAGVWNGGVETLSQALQLHPQIRKRVGVKNFFLPRTFYKYRTADTTKVFAARERMYAQVFPKMTQALIQDPNTIAMDVSSGYLFYASQTSVSIQCVTPWAKTIILLRHPVERVYYQWVYGKEKLGLRLPLEEWMAQELKAMESSGLISTNNRQQRLSKDEERKAWKEYQTKPNLAGAIGRSMYVLQLEEWFETLSAVGKEPKQEVYLMRSESWEAQPQNEYQQVIEFLGLASFSPSTLEPRKTYNNTKLPPINPETRQLLEDFFAPYNRRLATLLKKYGFNDGGDWKEPLWK